jgi:hypothetical protein
MKKLITMAATLAFAASTVIAAQQAEAPKQEAKPDAKAATGVAGKWLMSMETPNGTMNPGLDLMVDGKKVTGTLTSPQGEVAVAGEFADNKLALTASFQGNGGDVTITFAGTLKADGTMAGTMAFPQGEIPWTAARPK